MRLKRILFLVLFGAVVAAVIRRLMEQRPQARVDVYLADGSLTSLGDDAAEGALLLSLAREVRAAA
jgi:hypothetical protein